MLQDDIVIVVEHDDVEIIVDDTPEADVIVVGYTGPQGPVGPVGPQGPAVTPGGVGSFYITQAGPVAGWTNINRFKTDINGSLYWGDGSAIDTNLYRGGANILQTDDTFLAPVVRAKAGNNSVVIGQSAGAAASPDTFVGLYYNATSTRGELSALSGGVAWRDVLIGSNASLLANQIKFGTADANFDVNLYRSAADILKTDDHFLVMGNITLGGDGSFIARNRSSATAIFLASRITADTADRFDLSVDGRMVWGPGGATPPDVTLYRAGADHLRTDDRFTAAGADSFGIGLGVIGGHIASIRTVATDFVLATSITGDTSSRLIIDSSGKHTWGPGNAAIDTNLYRNAVNILKTDGAMVAGLQFTSLMSIAGSAAFYATQLAADGYMAAIKQAPDAQWRFLIAADGKMMWGPGGATLGTDVDLFRSATGVLKSIGSLELGNSGSGTLKVLPGGTTEISLGRWGPASEAAIRLGMDTTLYRSAAGVLKTDGHLYVNFNNQDAIQLPQQGGINFGGAVYLAGGPAGQNYVGLSHSLQAGTDVIARSGYGGGATTALVAMGQRGPANEAGIIFGNASDTNLYRQAADVLATDDVLLIRGNYISWGAAAAAGDTSLRRVSAGVLRAENSLAVYTSLWAASLDTTPTTTNVGVGGMGPTGQAGLKIGSDVTLYRSAADVLKTDDSLIVAGGLALGTSSPPAAGSIRFGDGTTMSTAPAAATRRVQSGSVSIAYPPGSAAITFPVAFSGTPTVVTSSNDAGAATGVQAVSATGATLAHNKGTVTTVYWIAEGPA